MKLIFPLFSKSLLGGGPDYLNMMTELVGSCRNKLSNMRSDMLQNYHADSFVSLSVSPIREFVS